MIYDFHLLADWLSGQWQPQTEQAVVWLNVLLFLWLLTERRA